MFIFFNNAYFTHIRSLKKKLSFQGLTYSPDLTEDLVSLKLKRGQLVEWFINYEASF